MGQAAQLVLAAGGAIASSAVGLGPGVGWAAGSLIGSQFGPKQNTQGPRLTDLKVLSGEYGDVIPWAAGHPRTRVQVWWSSRRREISQTSEVGKGGGSTQTSYSYEVDALFGLVDRTIKTVTRVWLNGKLIYTSLEASDDSSITASVNTDAWSRITVYTGADDQLPDPTYEAAVGAGNAPAYRGRGSVFIEGLNLGNSGVMPNLTFEVVIDADEYPGGLRLLTNFDDASTADESDYALGDAVESGTELTVSDGVFSFTQEESNFRTLSWAGPALQVDGGPLCVELLFRITPVAPIPPSGTVQVGRFIPLSTAPDDFWSIEINGLIGGQNQLAVTPPGGSFYTATDNVDALGYIYHFAIQFRANGTYDYYMNGRKVTPGANTNPAGHAFNASIYLGGTGQAGQTTINEYFGVRIAAREIYTAESFTPPTRFTRFDSVWTPNDDTLQNVVEDLCDLAGMSAGTYDASALSTITKPVRAIAIGQVVNIRTVLEQLQSAYFFDAYATDKLYFVPRGGVSATAIDLDDLATGQEQAEDEALPMNVGSNAEISAQVAVSYMNVDADYNTAAEQSDRLLTGQVNTAAVQLPIAFTSTEAKGIADAMVIDGYASRVTGRFSVPIEYAWLLPTRVIPVPDEDGNTYRVRIVRRIDDGNLLRFEWALDDASAIESAGITSEDYTSTINVATPGETVMRLLDIPLLRDADDYLGHYVAATSDSTSWPGASIQRSTDDVEFSEVAVVAERAVFGDATSALGDWTGGNVFDEVNSFTVNVGEGELSSSTNDALLADTTVNALAVGDEVIRFRQASGADGIYTISGLLRGQKGTEWAMGLHESGEAVSLLRPKGLRYVPIDLPSVDAERYYKGVTRGRALSSADSEAFTSNAVSLRPLSPVDIVAEVNSANDIVLRWNRRTRLSSAFMSSGGVPLGEASESYSIDVVLISGSVLKRTISTSSSTVTYTASQQSADGISGSTPIRFDVYQISSTVGRGRAGSLTTSGAVTPRAQITKITVGGTFASGAALYATLNGVTYNYTSVGGDTNLAGIATSFAAIIDAAAAYTASAVGADINVTGAVSAAFPVVVGVSAGDNTTTWALTQTASATVAGVSNKLTATWLNLSDPGGSNSYPLGTNFYLLVQRTSPPLNLVYTYNSTPSGRTDYTVRPIVASQLASAVAASGDPAAYGFTVQVDPGELWTLNVFTPASEPYNWTIQATTSNGAISGLVGNTASGVTPATLRPQINTLTLAGTPATGRIYRATLGGVSFSYTATGGDTTMALVATGLAAVIDANANYIASAVGAVITITHASNNVPFTYSASIIASTVTLSATNTQEAA